MGLSISDMEELSEGMILDMITESANDHEDGVYQEVADQADFDKF